MIFNNKYLKVFVVKGVLDKYNIIIRSVGMSNYCVLSFTFWIDLLLKKYEYV